MGERVKQSKSNHGNHPGCAMLAPVSVPFMDNYAIAEAATVKSATEIKPQGW